MKIALVSPKGGVGKTTLAVSLAWELQARKRRVLLVDADALGVARTASEVATERGMAAPTTIAMGKDMWRPDQLPRIAQAFDDVVIDTPGVLDQAPRAALMVADVVLVPISQSGIELWGNAHLLELIEQARAINKGLVAAFVVVRKSQATGLAKSVRNALAESGLTVLAAETTYRIAWQESIMCGMGVAQYKPKDKAALELRAVLDETLGLPLDVKEVANG